MKKLSFLIPHLIAVVIFIVLGAIYFAPQLEGYELNQSDIRQYIGMSKETSDFRDMEKKEPLWTNSAFGGMPTYQISMNSPHLLSTLESNIIFKVFHTPLAYLLIAMGSFYVLMLCFGVSPWLSVIGAIAFGFSSVNILFLAGGHNSKVHAIALMPGIIGSLIYAYRKNFRIGGLLLSIFICLQLSANHIQETYYLLFMILAIVIAEFYRFYINKNLPNFFKISAFVVIATVIGVIPTVSNLMLTQEYSKYTNRGKSELNQPLKVSGDIAESQGLDKDYIKEYSLGHGEVWSVALPNVKGGASGVLGNFKDELAGVSPQFRENIANFPSYWGEQSGTGGAFYFGATIFLLFVLGMVFIRDNLKWALLATVILAVVLSWKHSFILDLFIDHVPLFNKFRDTKMILALVQIIFPLVGMVFLNEMLKNQLSYKKLLYTIGAVVGLFVLFYLIPTVWFSFFNQAELDFFDKQIAQYPQAIQQIYQFQDEIKTVRIDIFKSDAMRSIIFMLGVSGLILLYVKKKMAPKYFLISLGILVLLDLWTVDKRYLNNDNRNAQWVKAQDKKYPFRPGTADLSILNHEVSEHPALKDKIEKAILAYQQSVTGPSRTKEIELQNLAFTTLNFESDYRVLSMDNPFADATTSYYHKSLGGYHAAKLKKYVELTEFRLYKEMEELTKAIKSNNDTLLALTLKTRIPALNMLNTKYIIINPEAEPIQNNFNNGPAWFVRDIKVVKNADEEIRALDTIDPKVTAVIQQKFSGNISANNRFDSLATIQLKLYRPNHLIYETNTTASQVGVFSEIYYKDGWNAYIDGKLTPHFCADYVLRGLSIPSGKHTIEFKFEPATYNVSRKISLAGSFMLVLFALGISLFEIWKKMKRKPVKD